MADEQRFAIYFSHSWRPADVELNLQVWHELADDCELLVDVPEEPGANPPYYINRIEELLRRTDLFLSVLTYRDPRPGEFSNVDARLRCSPYSLFEIRLAERADIPRLVLYERSTKFSPPRTVRPWEAYLPFDRGIDQRLVEQGQWEKVIQSKITQWKHWTTTHRRPTSYELSTCAALLVSADTDVGMCKVLEQSLRNEGYDPVRYSSSQRSSEAFRLLRESGLIVADFSNHDAVFTQLYAAAHAMGLPTIRMMPASTELELPWILRGEPGGYQNDIVAWSHPEDLAPLVEPRIKAMARVSAALPPKEGSDYLQSKRYSQFLVFISHNLKADRALVENIYALLKEQHVTPFEYHQVNISGIDWRQALDDSLRKTTHFVALLSPDFEQSQTCTYELEAILVRGGDVSILPFMIGGRTVPNPKLARLHNTLLDDSDPRVSADRVVKEIMAALTGALGVERRPTER